MRIEPYTDTSWTVTLGDGSSALIEIYDEVRRGVYGPVPEGVSTGAEGAHHFLAFTIDTDGSKPSPGQLRTGTDGSIGYQDLLGDSGRQVAVSAWQAWCDDEGRGWRERDSARAALVRSLEEAKQQEIAAATRLCDEQASYQTVVDAMHDLEARLGQI
jgi:hypothetical protein